MDSINHCNARRKSGALLSLDIKKAFDSTSHSYLQQAYKFFNFGPNFIKWLNLIGTNRKACIILGDGTYSDFFDLERGNAQGDTTSPYIFNIGFQILLLKLTFDLQIDGLIDFPTLPDNTPPLPHTGSRCRDGGEATRLDPGPEPEPEPVPPKRAWRTRDRAGGGACAGERPQQLVHGRARRQ